MPTDWCPRCNKLQPTKWDQLQHRWVWWPHDSAKDKRCPGGGEVVKHPRMDQR